MGSAALFRHIIEALFNPFCIGLVVFGFLLICLFFHNNSWMVFAGLLGIFLLLLLFSTGWFSQVITNRLEHQYPVVNSIDPGIHWIVVLGGGQQRHVNAPVNQLLSGQTIQRVVEGVRLYRQLPGSKLIMSGGGESDVTTSESTHMAELASLFSIPHHDLILETASINTADEVVEIKQWVHQQPFYLVTSAMHMPRSMALCHKQGLNPIAAPSGYPYGKAQDWQKIIMPHPENLSRISSAWHEVLGWVWGVITNKI